MDVIKKIVCLAGLVAIFSCVRKYGDIVVENGSGGQGLCIIVDRLSVLPQGRTVYGILLPKGENLRIERLYRGYHSVKVSFLGDVKAGLTQPTANTCAFDSTRYAEYEVNVEANGDAKVSFQQADLAGN